MYMYLRVSAKNLNESAVAQKSLFNLGFAWVNAGCELQQHKQFYARLSDKKIITCYHDPSIDDESITLNTAVHAVEINK